MEEKKEVYITTIRLSSADRDYWIRSRLNRTQVFGDFTQLLREAGEPFVLKLLEYLQKHKREGVKKIERVIDGA